MGQPPSAAPSATHLWHTRRCPNERPFTPNRLSALSRPFGVFHRCQKHLRMCRRIHPLRFATSRRQSASLIHSGSAAVGFHREPRRPEVVFFQHSFECDFLGRIFRHHLAPPFARGKRSSGWQPQPRSAIQNRSCEFACPAILLFSPSAHDPFRGVIAEILSRPENALAPFRAQARLAGFERGASTSEHK